MCEEISLNVYEKIVIVQAVIGVIGMVSYGAFDSDVGQKIWGACVTMLALEAIVFLLYIVVVH